MKKSTLLIVLIIFCGQNNLLAQKFTSISFSYFKELGQQDPVPGNAIVIGRYRGTVERTGSVSLNPATASEVSAILKSLKANGTEDINQCFIPRHAVTVYQGDAVLFQVMVCFECDGIRFTNEKQTTGIKNIAKREKLMASLKELFVKNKFDTKSKRGMLH